MIMDCGLPAASDGRTALRKPTEGNLDGRSAAGARWCQFGGSGGDMAWRLTFGLPLQPYRRGDVRQPTKQSSRREDGVEQARNEGSQEGSTFCRRETKEGPTLHIQSMKGAAAITCSCKWAASY